MSTGPTWKSLAVTLITVLAMMLLYLAPGVKRFVTDVDLQFTQLMFAVRGQIPLDEGTKVVGITENTINAFKDIDVYYPFPRNWHALAIRRLADAGARVVVFDILFSAKDSWDDEEDRSMRDAILYARDLGCDVVLAAASERINYMQGAYSDSLLQPASVIMEADPALGISNTLEKLDFKQIEIDSISLPIGEGGEPVIIRTQAVEAFRLWCESSNRDFEAELSEAMTSVRNSRTGDVWRYFTINYCSAPEAYPGHVYSYENLFVNDLNSGGETDLDESEALRLSGIFTNSVVFIGSRAHSDNDYFRTPFGKMYGVDTNAQAFDTLNRKRKIRTITPKVTLVLMLLLSLLAWRISLLRPIYRGVLIAVLPVGAIAALLLWLFSALSVEASVLMLNGGFIVPFVACTLYGGVAEELAKRRIRDTFSRYVSSEIVNQIISDPELADLGGAERNVAVLFSDIRNYSTITEDMTPHQIVEMLNIYLTEMTEIVRRHGGFVDKYIGDGLMACFGGPVPTEDPAGDATRAALEMIRVLKTDVAQALDVAGFPVFNIGIGLHFGPVIMGNIGSASRMDYTVIGDAVNVASRVEGQTREFGTAVIITKDCLDAASGEYTTQLLGERQVKGREKQVIMFSIVDPACEDMFRY